MLYRRPHLNTPAPPLRSRDYVYLAVTPELIGLAVAALNAWTSLEAETAPGTWRHECHLIYRTPASAKTAAKLLRDLQRQKSEETGPASDKIGHGDAIAAGTSRIRISWTEFLAQEPDFYVLAQQIVDAQTGAVVMLERRVKTLAKRYLKIFAHVSGTDPLAAYDVEDLGSEGIEWGNQLKGHYIAVSKFLRAIEIEAVEKKPEETLVNVPEHKVHIQDVDTILVDGTMLRLNRPRKAILFALAVTGTRRVEVEALARLYNDNLYRNPGIAANYAKIVQQALDALRQSLPHLRIEKVEPRRRTIHGVCIKSNVATGDLEWWLHNRTSA